MKVPFLYDLCFRARKSKIYLVFLLVAIFSGCDIDHGLAPTMGTIKGEITYKGSWPESPESIEVRIAVYAEYPPGDFYSISAYSEPLPTGVSSCNYTLPLYPGTYEWIIVVWREKGKSWSPKSFIGMYTSASGQPGSIDLQRGELIEGIDIIADFSKAGQLPPEVEEALAPEVE